MQNRTTPWYKQFWPWFLIALPTSSFIVGGIVLNFAINTPDSLVHDDYYKEGKAINVNLERVENAKALGISSLLTVKDGLVSVNFLTGRPSSGQALSIAFRHTTLKSRDTQVLMTTDANGVFRASLPDDMAGKWRVTLTPLDASWKIQQTLVLPQTQPIPFNP